MQLNDIKNALLTVTTAVKHYDGTGTTGNYIVWAEDGQGDSICADGLMQEQATTGTIDYFTKLEYDPNFGKIQAALKAIGVSYRWQSTQYETDTKYIHHEWSFEVV